MGARKLLEGDVDLILAHIKANISAALAAIRADRADAAVTTEPPPKDAYFTYPRAVGYQTPAVFVVGDSMAFLQESGPNFIKAISSVNVTVLIEDRTASRLVIKSYRYMCALHELLEQTTLITADEKLKIVCKVTRAENSPLYSTSEDESAVENVFRKEVSLFLDVEHWENF
jgi:hypothetical protein